MRPAYAGALRREHPHLRRRDANLDGAARHEFDAAAEMRLVGDELGASRINPVAHEFAQKFALGDRAVNPDAVGGAGAVRRRETQRMRPKCDWSAMSSVPRASIR